MQRLSYQGAVRILPTAFLKNQDAPCVQPVPEYAVMEIVREVLQ
jgi:hypothetical protein